MDQASGPLGGAAINWRAPWFAPWHERGERVARQVQSGEPVHMALDREHGAPVRFVAPPALPAGMPYEQYIFETGNCPTRNNFHDFFNGLLWLEMPRSKRQLNLLQAAQIAGQGVGGARGAVRDAITVFDENGALLAAPQPLFEALAVKDWRRLFVEMRPLWADARLLVFGHALLEKLVHPRKNLTAHVWNVSCPAQSMAQMDEWLASQLGEHQLAAKPFLPLPVLGVPGWWPENQNFSFYDDSLVFRPAARPLAISRPPASQPT